MVQNEQAFPLAPLIPNMKPEFRQSNQLIKEFPKAFQ